MFYLGIIGKHNKNANFSTREYVENCKTANLRARKNKYNYSNWEHFQEKQLSHFQLPPFFICVVPVALRKT